MVIKKITLKRFRNYSSDEFEFSKGINIITGPNGSGKTNLLEAIYVLMSGRSFRDGDRYLAMHGADWWRLDGVIGKHERQVRFQDGRKQYIDQGITYQRRPKNFSLPVILFEPEHLQLVHGSPRSRRLFIDSIASWQNPSYPASLRQYERILQQRNKLLKSSPVDKDQLFIWDMQLADVASVIHQARQDIIKDWNDSLSKIYSHIASSKTNLKVKYISSVPSDQYKQSIIRLLHTHIERDCLLGTTTIGPHRDDYSFLIDQADFAVTASRGEVRSLLLAITYRNYQRMSELSTEAPLVLLDDVFSEFDSTRQAQLLKLFANSTMIITGTDNDMSAIKTKAVRIDLG